MAYDKKGKVPKVKDRWYGDHKYRHGRELKPREFKGTPQFTFNELYITPFTHHRALQRGRTGDVCTPGAQLAADGHPCDGRFPALAVRRPH